MKSGDITRTKKAYLNAVVTLISHILQIFLGFVSRKLFIDYLGVEYLGYNSVFQNLLQMLNLADLGIGVAITSFLYKPLAVGDKKVTSSLMYIYKKIYSILGIVVLVIGVFLTLIINYIVPDANCSIGYLRILFIINLIGTVSTYYMAYNRTLLIADQKSYLTSLIDTIAYFIMTFLQVIILLVYPNYIVYLCLNVIKNIATNIIISIECKKRYKYIGSAVDQQVVQEYKPQIIQYVKDVFVSKIGSYVYYSTDNIIISIFKGSLLTGYLSNYTLVTSQVNTIISQLLASIQATFGNYVNVTSDKKLQMKMTDNYLCVNFCMGNFCMLCVMFLIQPFISLFFGLNYVLENSTAFLLSLNLMLTILIQIPSQVFMIYKLYHYDKPIVCFSAIANILISSVLVNIIGVNGVLIGTTITSFFYLFSRFYIISKKVYNINYTHYILRILSYFLVSALSIVATFLIVRNFTEKTVVLFIIRAVFVVIVAIVIPSICLFFTKEFQFLLGKIIPRKFKALFSYKRIFLILIVFFIVSFIVGILFGEFNNTSNNYDADKSNKSFQRQDMYVNEGASNQKIFHLSIDDFIVAFQDITLHESDYDSVFENSTFGWMKEMHNKYNVVFSCYVHYEDKDFNLSICTNKFKDEFEANADWLRFGFHSINGDTIYGEDDQQIVDDYNKTIEALINIVSESAIDNVIRLQSFQGSEGQINALINNVQEEPVIGLLTADDSRQSYYLNEDSNNYIYSHDVLVDKNNGIFLVSSDCRIEFIESVEDKIKEFESPAWNNQLGYLEIFTHEWIIDNTIKYKIEHLCKYANENAYVSAFYEDILK